MEILIPASLIFVVTVVVLELLFFAYRYIKHPDRARIQKKLRQISTDRYEDKAPELIRKRVLSDVPALNQILLRITMIHRLDSLRYQANAKYPTGFFILLSLLFAGSGLLAFYIFTGLGLLLSGAIGLALATLPFLYLNLKKKRRMSKFQAQLPEALDLMARSLRAGHAFSTGMKLASDEFEDPLGPEFALTLDEINYGLGVPEALKNLVNRVDCMDLNFFVIAVILQRETGGNLAEVMENIAYLIRERFKLFGQIRTLAAEGKLSMYVLLALPFLVAGALFLTRPNYIISLVTEPVGRVMCGIAFFMMLIGAYIMKRMVDIKV
jgi:tight adherence protein B